MDATDIAAGALSAFGTSQAVTANNIANLNTGGYAPRVTVLETGPGGEGVRVADIYTPSPQSAAPPSYAASGRPADGSDAADRASAEADEAARSADEAARAARLARPSEVDLARETVQSMADERAFGANLAVLSTADGMKGMIFDLMV
jgi:flagellar basal-body rod protein FlgC